MDEVDVDDASQMLATFKDQDIMAYFESTRNGTGHRNQNRIEVAGSKGAIIWDEEKLNELEYYNDADPANLNVITSYSIHYTKLYECLIWMG